MTDHSLHKMRPPYRWLSLVFVPIEVFLEKAHRSIGEKLVLSRDRVVDDVQPRKQSMNDGPENRVIYAPGNRDRQRCSKTDSRFYGTVTLRHCFLV
jgi:hypothetical protein